MLRFISNSKISLPAVILHYSLALSKRFKRSRHSFVRFLPRKIYNIQRNYNHQLADFLGNLTRKPTPNPPSIFFFFCWSPECLIGCYWPSPSHGFWGTISILSLYVYFINFIILIKISYTLSIAILCQTMFFFLYCLFANKLRSFCTATGNRIWRSLYGSFEAYYLLYLLTLTSYRLWWTDPYRTNIAACHNFQW